MSDLYTGQCGVQLVKPAPGILVNDARDAGKTLTVVDPQLISIDPKYGTITVNADGSFVYDAAANIASGSYVTFYYKVTDGSCTSAQALVKIQVSCKCTAKAPEITVCEGVEITPEFLISKGAGCFGSCGDVTNIFDLSKIPAEPEPGIPYPYTVTCPGCIKLTGHVTFRPPCEITWQPFTICPGVELTEDMIRAEGQVACDCDTTPTISGIVLVDDHWEYTITCDSACGPATETGRVDIEPPCEITWQPFTICPDAPLPTAEQILAEAHVACDCDTTPAISGIQLVDDHIEYIITCESARGCITTETGRVDIEPPCDIEAIGFDWCPDGEFRAPTPAEVLEMAQVTCSCDETPVISDIHVVTPGSIEPPVEAEWAYTITCTSENGCVTTLEGIFTACGPLCPAAEAPDFCVCPGTVLTEQMFIDKGATCLPVGCPDCNMVIDFSEVNTNVEGTYDYTVTCSSSTEGCEPFVATGTVDVTKDCNCPCTCTPVAPPICACKGTPLSDQDFIDQGVKCTGTGCSATPVIDDSDVDYDTIGTYTYTVTCEDGCEPATGHVCVREKLCGPAAGTILTTNLLEGDTLIDVGDVKVEVVGANLVVTFTTTAPCGFASTHLYVGTTPSTTCSPGQFPYKHENLNGATTDTYTIPLNTIGFRCDVPPTFYMDAHASMSGAGCEGTAWGEGECGTGCGFGTVSVGEICFEIPCNCLCPTTHCPPCKG